MLRASPNNFETKFKFQVVTEMRYTTRYYMVVMLSEVRTKKPQVVAAEFAIY